ncbi:hypothetical protein ABZW18_25115 [Streptomyces sp. NPDC004647]|uniref:hypothetical protein n=1 Tax=Streptomyces sp. NPDC004647 TaxID=3154671 RepID=UPI0033B2DDDB
MATQNEDQGQKGRRKKAWERTKRFVRSAAKWAVPVRHRATPWRTATTGARPRPARTHPPGTAGRPSADRRPGRPARR